MIFDWNGLQTRRHFLLIQKNNPLKYCNYNLPFPMPIGLPFMPCDLPNEYELIATSQDYTQQQQTLLNLEEEVTFLNRFILPASHRPFMMIGKDYYQHIPYRAVRKFNCCFSKKDRPSILVYFQDRYVGKVVQTSIINCCCLGQNSTFQQFELLDEEDQVLYRVTAKGGQKGEMLILPWWGFDKIIYYIIQGKKRSSFIRKKKSSRQRAKKKYQPSFKNKYKKLGENQEDDKPPQIDTQILSQTDSQKNQIHDQEQGEKIPIEQEEDEQGQVVGQIVHLFNGFSEYTSKNDKYGLTLPENASQEDKCMLIYCAIMINYLLFENF